MRRRWQTPRNSLQGARYQPGNGPPLLVALGQSWGLAEHQQRAWWKALCAAQWSQAVAFREAVIAFSPEREGAREVVHTTCNPHAVVTILEALVEEGVLWRETATQIEEGVLSQTDRAGRWKGSPYVQM